MSYYHLPEDNRFQGYFHRTSRQMALQPTLNDVFPLDARPSFPLPPYVPRPEREFSAPFVSRGPFPMYGPPGPYRDPYLAHPYPGEMTWPRDPRVDHMREALRREDPRREIYLREAHMREGFRREDPRREIYPREDPMREGFRREDPRREIYPREEDARERHTRDTGHRVKFRTEDEYQEHWEPPKPVRRAAPEQAHPDPRPRSGPAPRGGNKEGRSRDLRVADSEEAPEPTPREYNGSIPTPRVREYNARALSFRQPVEYRGDVGYELTELNYWNNTLGRRANVHGKAAATPPKARATKPAAAEAPIRKAVDARNEVRDYPRPSKAPSLQNVPEDRELQQQEQDTRRTPAEDARFRPDANLPEQRYQTSEPFQVQGAEGASGFVPSLDLNLNGRSDRVKDGGGDPTRTESFQGIPGRGGPETPHLPGSPSVQERREFWNTTIGSLLDEKPYGDQVKKSEVMDGERKVKDTFRSGQGGGDSESPRRHGNLPISLRPGASPYLGKPSPKASGRDSNAKMATGVPGNVEQAPVESSPQPEVVPFWTGDVTTGREERQASPNADPEAASPDNVTAQTGESPAPVPQKPKTTASRAEVTLKPDELWDWNSVLDLDKQNQDKPEVKMFGPPPSTLRMGLQRKAKHPYDELVRDGSADRDLDRRRKAKGQGEPKTLMRKGDKRRRDKWLESIGLPLTRTKGSFHPLLEELREDRKLYLTARSKEDGRRRHSQPFSLSREGKREVLTNRKSIRFADENVFLPIKVDVDSLIDPVPQKTDRRSRLDIIRGSNFEPDTREITQRRASSLPDETTQLRATGAIKDF